MLSSSVTTKGQVTIPAELREKLGIKPGDRVGFIEKNGKVEIQRQEEARRVAGRETRRLSFSAATQAMAAFRPVSQAGRWHTAVIGSIYFGLISRTDGKYSR